MLNIMGSRISLVEDELATVRFTRAARRGATGTEFEGAITGNFAGPHATLAVLNKNLNGLNDLRLSEVPITSDRFPDTLNGWYRINSVSSTLNRLTPTISRLTWNIRATRIRGEFDVYMTGVTRDNTQNTGSTKLIGIPTIGVPEAAVGQFFPAAIDVGNRPRSSTYLIDTRWSRNSEEMIIYQPRSVVAEFRSGFRYALKAEDGDLGQCIVNINGNPCVGLAERIFNFTDDESWLVSNGLVTISQTHGQDIWVTYANATDTYRWRLNYINVAGTKVTFPSRISVLASNYYTLAVRLMYTTAAGEDPYDSGMYLVLRRGARFAVITNMRGKLKVEGSATTSGFYINQVGTSFGSSVTTQGVMQISGNDPVVSSGTIGLRNPGSDVAYVYVDGNTKNLNGTRRLQRHREFLGAQSQRIRTILI